MFVSFSNWLKNNPLLAFFVLTFLIAWSIWLPVGLLAPQYFVWTIIPGAWAPSIAAISLTSLAEGKAGIRKFLGRLFKWRIRFQWYLVVLFGIAVIAYAANGINLILGGDVPMVTPPTGLPREAVIGALPMIFLINIFAGGPLAEDIGWRGYILPKLRRRMNALNASLIIGIVWVVWHAPFYFFPEGRVAVGNVPFIWFGLLTIAWSVLFAWVYVNTESILMPVLFHAAINTTLGTLGVLGQSSGDIMPLILNTVLTWVAVGVVVKVFGRDLTRKVHSAGSNIDAELHRA